MERGGSIRSSVETIVPGPAFQRNSEPGASGPAKNIDFTSGFQSGQFSNLVSTSQTTWGDASMSISAPLLTGALPFGVTCSAARVLGDVGGNIADLRLAQAPGERRHTTAARLDLRAYSPEVGLQVVEVRSDLARGRRGGERVTGTAARLLEDGRAGSCVGRGRDRSRLARRRGGSVLAVEPDRARVPDADQGREQQSARGRQHETWKPVQADDRHLRCERAVDGAAEERVGQHAGARVAEAELEDAVVSDRERESEGEAARPPVHRIDPGRLPPRQLVEDPGGREELEAGQDHDRGREARLEVDRIAEEKPKVALRPRLVVRQEAGRERDDREREQRRREPAVRPRGRRRCCGGLAHRLLSNRSAAERSSLTERWPERPVSDTRLKRPGSSTPQVCRERDFLSPAMARIAA